MTNVLLHQICDEIAVEATRAQTKHKPMNSAHEAYAVILEELDELWDEIKKKVPDKPKLREEAIQTAAMCVRFIHDVVDK
jgi:hypothetical protein